LQAGKASATSNKCLSSPLSWLASSNQSFILSAVQKSKSLSQCIAALVVIENTGHRIQWGMVVEKNLNKLKGSKALFLPSHTHTQS